MTDAEVPRDLFDDDPVEITSQYEQIAQMLAQEGRAQNVEMPRLEEIQVGSGNRFADALTMAGEALQGRSDFRQTMSAQRAANADAKNRAKLEQYQQQMQTARESMQQEAADRREMAKIVADAIKQDTKDLLDRWAAGGFDSRIVARQTPGGALVRQKMREKIPELAELDDEQLIAAVQAQREVMFDLPKRKAESDLANTKTDNADQAFRTALYERDVANRERRTAQLGDVGSAKILSGRSAVKDKANAEQELAALRAEYVRVGELARSVSFKKDFKDVGALVAADKVGDKKAAQHLDQKQTVRVMGRVDKKSLRQIITEMDALTAQIQSLDSIIAQSDAVLDRVQRELESPEGALEDYFGVKRDE